MTADVLDAVRRRDLLKLVLIALMSLFWWILFDIFTFVHDMPFVDLQNGKPAIMHAALNDRKVILQMLISSGADINHQDKVRTLVYVPNDVPLSVG